MDDLKQRFPIYSKVLRLYPLAYRKRYGEQMLQMTADMLDDTPRQRHGRVWLHVATELPASVIRERVVDASVVLAHETPHYVQRNTALSLLLLVPFCAIAVVNDMTGNGLYHTWFWDFRVLLTWILILPAASLLLSGSTFLAWLYGQRKQGTPLRQSVTDFRHNWVILGMILLGLFILTLVFFHDSVHCVTGNPIRELHNPYQTWQCIDAGTFK